MQKDEPKPTEGSEAAEPMSREARQREREDDRRAVAKLFRAIGVDEQTVRIIISQIR